MFVCEVKKLEWTVYTPARCVATSITEPLLAGIAVHHTRRIMDTTVAEEQQNSILNTAKYDNYSSFPRPKAKQYSFTLLLINTITCHNTWNFNLWDLKKKKKTILNISQYNDKRREKGTRNHVNHVTEMYYTVLCNYKKKNKQTGWHYIRSTISWRPDIMLLLSMYLHACTGRSLV